MINDNEYSWVRYIKSRIRNNKNFLSICSGPTGSGKSWSMLSISEMLDPEFNVERIVFRGIDLMKLVNSGTLKKGSVILFDESQIDLNARSWQSLINKMLNFLITTFRHQNFILLFTSPYADFIDSSTMKLFHANFETVSINRRDKTVSLKPKLLQYNQSLKKWYRKYLKMIHNSGMIKIKRWKVPKPSQKLIDEYELKKKAFTQLLNIDIQAKMQKKMDKDNKDDNIKVEKEIPNAKCGKCGHEWHTNSNKSLFTCTNCGSKRGKLLENQLPTTTKTQSLNLTSNVQLSSN